MMYGGAPFASTPFAAGFLGVGGDGDAVAVQATNEITLGKWYVRRGQKLHIFATGADADAFIEADEKAAAAIAQAQKTSRRARKRLLKKVISVAPPENTVHIDRLAQLVNLYAVPVNPPELLALQDSVPVNLPELLALQDWQRGLEVMALARQAQDEEDIEMLLMA